MRAGDGIDRKPPQGDLYAVVAQKAPHYRQGRDESAGILSMLGPHPTPQPQPPATMFQTRWCRLGASVGIAKGLMAGLVNEHQQEQARQGFLGPHSATCLLLTLLLQQHAYMSVRVASMDMANMVLGSGRRPEWAFERNSSVF